MNENTSFFTGALDLYIGSILKYFFFAGIPFLIFYVFFPNSFKNNKIQEGHHSKKSDFIREVYFSNQSLIISLFMTAPLLFTPVVKYTAFTFSFTHLKYVSVWWSPLILLVVFFLHDTYFYWVHVLFHKPFFLKHFHIVHHKSHNPTSLSSLSFSYTEAIFQMFFNIIIVFLVPLDETIIIIFGIVAFICNSYGHLGYEIMPLGFRKSFLFPILVTSTHHNLHHSKTHYNFGLYFRFWDRLMKTEYPKYEEVYDKIQARRMAKITS